MNICRTCLETPADKHISELEKDIKETNRNCFDIMLFCLDIEVTHGSKITRHLCSKCYTKIVTFYNFKTTSLKNDSYLKSLDPALGLETQKLSGYVDENGIKQEEIVDKDCKADIKIEIEIMNDESLGDLEVDVKKEYTSEDAETYVEPVCFKDKVESRNISDNSEKNAPVYQQSVPPKKFPSAKVQQKREVCEECGKSFRNVKKHALQHRPRGERQAIQCEACPKTFINKTSLKNHYKNTHLGIKSKCDICNKVVIHLSVHKMQVHNPDTLRYGCPTCERRFITRAALDLHATVHTRDLKYQCDICQKKFRLRNSILRHIRDFHQKERNHQCKLCNKAFFGKMSFKRHLESHSNERLYKCKKCDKAFKTKEYLRKHSRITHSDVKNFNCELCSKSFKRSSDRNTHMRTHTGEKPYPCRHCDARFRQTSARKRHELVMHEELNKF
ncbi:zinc finger protein 155-like [Cydia pomonella]|uniref:zinc finger protein 155-like n=1 Tax=Cydia pomonella TaxID=82600 RepID=UPI002ADD59EA|nr:zinc finger protein 155-like [Cydia pomonella]